MQLQFCGAAGTVTGSAHLLTLDDGTKILLDCGLYQGNEPEYANFNERFLFRPDEIDIVVLSHAHIDHCGRLPKLVKDGFRGRIYATHATRDLTAILLLDSAHIQDRESSFTNRRRKDDHEDEPLYDAKDVADTMELFRTVGYNKWFGIHPDVEVVYKDAGHILGSATVTLRIKRHGMRDYLLGFTADIGRPDRPILRDPVPMDACDFLICESTYGDRLHEEAPQEKEHFLRVIQQTCVTQKGKLIIPAFSVGRTQEIVYMLDQLVRENRLPDVPVYVDSPLAVNATRVFEMHPECFDKEILDYMALDPNPFGFEKLKYTRSVEESKAINNKKGCIVISASGMINAGRVKHHVFNAIEHPENTILIVGYCADNTPGGQLRNGAKQIRMFGEYKSVNAHVEIMSSFSAHGDYREMIDFLRSQEKDKLRNIILVHGDKNALTGFRDHLHEAGFGQVDIPKLGDKVDL
ncbi:MAG TPA: MBL fold metallo-hydrolase [Chitinophagales bacterium]|nr:MBL fold metallo-hydrolase [Chitinophagales bacterium]HNM07133.1 MBL fold metallo-hydrolase [Chitinophagales bacterium]